MSSSKLIDLGRSYQNRAYRYARNELVSRKDKGPTGGIILADGVGLGKTYEALATVATILTQRQHGKEKKRRSQYHILVLVPPRLLTKWLDELILPDRFPRYLEDWNTPATRAVRDTFRNVAVIRGMGSLYEHKGKLRNRHNQLPPGLYLTKSTIIKKQGNKASQLRRTPWDAIIIDEAHHLKHPLDNKETQDLLAHNDAATLLLTATPFQLSPSELGGILEATFGGYGISGDVGKARSKAADLYYDDNFVEYREALQRLFREPTPADKRIAKRLKEPVSKLLRHRIIRNRKVEQRMYYLVDETGKPTRVGADLFRSSEVDICKTLEQGNAISLDEQSELAYLRVRALLSRLASGPRKTFLATSLRQLLSTYGQFRKTKVGRSEDLPQLPSENKHPKLVSVTRLARGIFKDEKSNLKSDNWIRKALVFTTYVGAEPGEATSKILGERAHGSAARLKRELEREMKRIFPRKKRRKERGAILKALLKVIEEHGSALVDDEKPRLQNVLRGFAGRPVTLLLLSPKNRPGALKKEMGVLRGDLEALSEQREMQNNESDEEYSEEMDRRRNERSRALFETILHRYSNRDLVARYDGATKTEERDRHLRGFNTPFAPLVLIASSVGQEGIDLQKYCAHVIHYDLEWNPAKLEQREGRVDRHGRILKGPINVYLLICKGTYDERMLHVMVNRFRWHHVLLGNRRYLDEVPGLTAETQAPPDLMNLALDLAPR